jgi:hypothetical protein
MLLIIGLTFVGCVTWLFWDEISEFPTKLIQLMLKPFRLLILNWQDRTSPHHVEIKQLKQSLRALGRLGNNRTLDHDTNMQIIQLWNRLTELRDEPYKHRLIDAKADATLALHVADHQIEDNERTREARKESYDAQSL